MGNKPLVTVVTVTYNCSLDIENTLKSVLSQNYPNLEYIIVDGASEDETLTIIRKYEDKITKIVSEPDKGLYDAMNKGINIARGHWINFMNAGDTYSDCNTISTIFQNIYTDTGYKVLYGITKFIHKDYSESFHKTATGNTLTSIVHKYQPYTHQAVFYNIVDKNDCYYNIKYRIAADYDVACRYFKKYGSAAFHYMDVVVCAYKAYDGVSTKLENKKKALKEKILVKLNNHMSILETMKDIRRMLLLK
jgi:Glycosyltransferases involved in cell wall biogenesis